MAAEIRDLAFTIRAIDSASATVDEIANKLRAATEGQAASVVNAQRRIAEIIARGDPAKAQALELEKQLSQLQNYAIRAKAGTAEVEAARTQIIKDFEARRATASATGAETAKRGFREIGQAVGTMSHLFGGASQSIVSDVAKIAAGFAAGNVLGLAIAGTTTLVSKLAEAFMEVREHATRSADAATKRWDTARVDISKQISEIKAATERLRIEARGDDPGIIAAQQTAAKAQGIADAARANFEELARGSQHTLADLQKMYAQFGEAMNVGGVGFTVAEMRNLEKADAEMRSASKNAEAARVAAFDFAIAQQTNLENKQIEHTAKTSNRRVEIIESAESRIAKRIAGMASVVAEITESQAASQNEIAQAAGDAAWEAMEEREERIRSAADAAFDEVPEIPENKYAEAGVNAGFSFARGIKSALESGDPMDIFGAILSGAGAILGLIPGLGIAGTALSGLAGFFEDGGPVLPQGRAGLATINNDAIPAILHPNEFVLDAPTVSAMGGIGAVESMRRDLKSSQSQAPRGRELIAINAPLPVEVYRSFVGPGQSRALRDRQSGMAARALRNATQAPRYK